MTNSEIKSIIENIITISIMQGENEATFSKGEISKSMSSKETEAYEFRMKQYNSIILPVLNDEQKSYLDTVITKSKMQGELKSHFESNAISEKRFNKSFEALTFGIESNISYMELN